MKTGGNGWEINGWTLWIIFTILEEPIPHSDGFAPEKFEGAYPGQFPSACLVRAMTSAATRVIFLLAKGSQRKVLTGFKILIFAWPKAKEMAERNRCRISQAKGPWITEYS